MVLCRNGVSSGFTACAALLVVSIGSTAVAEDVYFHRAVSELKGTEGHLPKAPAQESPPFRRPSLFREAVQPYAVIEGAGEVYLYRHVSDLQANLGLAQEPDRLTGDHVVVFKVPVRREVSGRLFVPNADGQGMTAVAFKAEPPPAQKDGKSLFGRAKVQHYERLAARGLPGAAWFRHRVREAEAQTSVNTANRGNVTALPARSTLLEQTYELFSGNQAVNENLQLDRPITTQGAAADPTGRAAKVKTESLKGITVAEMDWSARLEGKTPALDPLAAGIPADQHAVFLPGLKAVAALMGELHGASIPVLGLLANHTEDRHVQRRYERQLGVKLDDLGRAPAAAGIRSLAVTGSDPYLPSGSDLALLFETDSPDDLAAFFKGRIDAARQSNPDAEDAGGRIDGVPYFGAKTTDRSLSSYSAVLGKIVGLTNSRVQLKRLIETAQEKTPVLATQPEYRFFRDRYPRGDTDETAFLVLTDATIRRWCGPRWRIGSSRRVRARALLDEIQAESLTAVVGESTEGTTPKAPSGSIELGALRLNRSGVRSEIYGTVEFQTPIAELTLDEVERAEADAYGRWRDGYQQNWRGVFDPIAARVTVKSGRLAADVSVMPLIVASEYKQFVELVGGARIVPESGDRHQDALAHAVMALDVRSKLFTNGGSQIAALTHVPQQVALGWLGQSAALYADDDPFWAELVSSSNTQDFVKKQGHRLPVGVHFEVSNGAKLALFLTGLRAFIEQAAPNLTTWENREHKGQRYLRITEAEGARPRGDGPKFAIHYYASPRSLTLSLNEDVVRRAIERQEEKAPNDRESKPGPWLGKSLALRVSGRAIRTLGQAGKAEFHDALRLRAWNNLPILTEWKRLFPDKDPVALHRSIWGATLVEPGGGHYVWNERWGTMESTVFGHPGEPKDASQLAEPLAGIVSAAQGVSFEDGGLRAKTEVERRPKP